MCILNLFKGSQLVTLAPIFSVTRGWMNSRRGMEAHLGLFMSHVRFTFLLLLDLSSLSMRRVALHNVHLAEVDAGLCRLKLGRLRRRLTSPLAWAG